MSYWTVIAVVSLLSWLWLLLGQGMFWRTDVRLPPGAEPREWPSVAVVVPARDEAEVLPVSLPSLLAQDYPGRASVFLVDDGSTDGTGQLAARLASGGGVPLTVTSPGEPPQGWTGKLWAVRHGVRRATADAAPDYLLLTDADIAHEPDSLRALVASAHACGYDVVSQMARLRVETGWERLIVPAFVYFFAQLYPFRWISRRGRTAAAAGGCVLIRRSALEAARVPDSIRHAVIDDVALARAVKGGGGSVWLGLATRVDSVRPYPRLSQLWRMVSRSAYAQLRHNPALLLGTLLGLALIYLVPPVAAIAGAAAGAPGVCAAGFAAWAVMAGTYLPMLRYYRQPWWLAPTLPFTAGLYALMTADSAVQHYRGRGAAWKGRTYDRPSASQLAAARNAEDDGVAEG
ncbi:glycosyltransferase [Streptantibioticus silvisoli]|uniref:Glycosyltransferase n=1 Tax=Streptantibioticus silvisoli TaxID=2705255 RepID=A0ABT6W9V4_9ACTN|nr:glycosyltransferase [Streptantibioticus silvisoli]MDI5966722.1 glycosyltransferase [Streptantibioticus silvisoli]